MGYLALILPCWKRYFRGGISSLITHDEKVIFLLFGGGVFPLHSHSENVIFRCMCGGWFCLTLPEHILSYFNTYICSLSCKALRLKNDNWTTYRNKHKIQNASRNELKQRKDTNVNFPNIYKTLDNVQLEKKNIFQLVFH